MHIFWAILGLLSLFYASITDALHRIIPNECAAVAFLAGFALRLNEGIWSLLASAAVAVALFAFMVLLFHRGVVGGGDAKLLPAATLLFPAAAVPMLLFWISLAGGLLAIGMLLVDRMPNRRDKAIARDLTARQDKNSASTPAADTDELGFQGDGLPYGIAIFLGALATQVMLP